MHSLNKTPVSTYRLQIRPSFTLHDAADLVPYLRDLGVDWLYLSPILTAEKGSDHGYDVVDPTSVDPDRGGREGLVRLSTAAHAAGMGLLVDIVPNHMGVATPRANSWWWSLLREGRASRYAEAFDVDWDAGRGRLRLPVLGDGDSEESSLRLVRDDDGGFELHYFDHAFPVAPGTAADGDDPAAVHARQHYELVNWRRADAELNYRRFFGVNSLAGLRVEVDWVFDEAHAEVRSWFEDGLVDGLRIDHPDGLADPAGYLRRLHELTGGAYVLVEKILEPGEKLPPDWACAGTTGYDALADVDRLFVDPRGREALSDVVPGDDSYRQMIHDTKRAIADGLLHSEVQRLTRLVPADAGLDPSSAADALAEILSCFPVYRSYLPHGREYLDQAVIAARVHRPDLAEAITVLHPLLGPAGDAAATELAVRFQQTSGMVMAKGVEDTAFYRYTRLTSLNEVGADPSEFAVEPFELHTRFAVRQLELPDSMTTLSTHDTKRSEDTRARISVLSEAAEAWAEFLPRFESKVPVEDLAFADLLWQAAIGAWPLSRERAHAYAEKAAREAGNSTSWTDPNTGFEEGMHAAIDQAFDDPAVNEAVSAMAAGLAPAGRSNSLAAKLVQLTMPGVPDVYQGTEFWDYSLVDPDNRRPVDFAARAAALAELDAGAALPPVEADGRAKLLLVSRALRLRRGRPELFTGYEAVAVEGEDEQHLFGFDRGGAITLVTRLPLGLAEGGGWHDTAALLAPGSYRDVVTGRLLESDGRLYAREVFAVYPAALLVREDA
ncbi:malto-oligosyltrehalose synthase [Zafaria cholistanensis]|uniref:Malto-oligosyltrehalose synthase n=1 Tax=Zafaria cholistanensis TaxID=1682741 RepID=A0A5A7NRV6_9MICC|nr:malto-oligosyltrehalose synthase [Zafaria cholistanensis]GER23459.1 malto-oligosyltrehalose synthase [Zafaria cholistanensis]